VLLLERRERLTPADHQTHRRYAFRVPAACTRLTFKVRYEPKLLSAGESADLLKRAVRAQTQDLAAKVGAALAERWAEDFDGAELIVPNLLTISVDDAAGVYRGAGHRHRPDQELTLGTESASAGLVAGPLPAGEWVLTVTTHTLVSPQCDMEIQIGAEIASVEPSGLASRA
jgi:hypothetical protein